MDTNETGSAGGSIALAAAHVSTEPRLHGLTKDESLEALHEGFHMPDPPGSLHNFGAGRRALPRTTTLRAVGHLMSRLGMPAPDDLTEVLDTEGYVAGWSTLCVNACERVAIGYPHLTNVILFEAAVAPSGRVQAQYVGRCHRL